MESKTGVNRDAQKDGANAQPCVFKPQSRQAEPFDHAAKTGQMLIGMDKQDLRG
jgi:hypothetical protein